MEDCAPVVQELYVYTVALDVFAGNSVIVIQKKLNKGGNNPYPVGILEGMLLKLNWC